MQIRLFQKSMSYVRTNISFELVLLVTTKLSEIMRWSEQVWDTHRLIFGVNYFPLIS